VKTAVVTLVFVFFSLFQIPVFGYQLEYDQGIHAPSKLLQLINLVTGAFALSVVYGSSAGRAAARACWPLWGMVLLALCSTVWSTDPIATVRGAITLLICVLFGLAITIRFPGFAGIRFVIRVMTLACVLSVIWALMLPRVAVHQATDLVQYVHAGLWRGIFTHKQGLGPFAGVTFGLVLFYGSMVFPFIIRLVALGCAAACMWGSQSATGALMALLITSALFTTYWIACLGPVARKILLRSFVIGVVVMLVAFYFGLLSFIPTLFGKSSDLTGRGEGWALLQNSFANSGRQLLGGGYMSGFAMDMTFNAPIDNGYFVKLMEFGYLGCAVLFFILGWIFVASVRLVVKTKPEVAAFHVFPASIMIIMTFYSIAETGLMEKNIWMILITIAVRAIMVEREARRTKPPGPRGGAAPSGKAGPRSTAVNRGVIQGGV
jgi:exopolysaccharide production protein ExoQ